eukprot:2965571-Prymnesium_polylepis.1
MARASRAASSRWGTARTTRLGNTRISREPGRGRPEDHEAARGAEGGGPVYDERGDECPAAVKQ